MQSSKERYEKRKVFYASRLEKLTLRINRLSNLRIATFLAGCGLAAYLYRGQSSAWGLGAGVLTLALFFILVSYHQTLKNQRSYLKLLLEINDQGLQRISGEWKFFSDTGDDFLDPTHPYSYDLDLFGPSSLFQWMNTAKTFLGRERLKEILAEPPEQIDVIQSKQEAITELSGILAWRQRFMADARSLKGSSSSPKSIIEWAKSYDMLYLRPEIMVLARALPIITITFLLLDLLSSKVSFWYPLTGFVLQAIILFAGKHRGKVLNSVYTYKENIKVYEKMLERFEKRTFQSAYLQALKKGLKDREGKPAFEQIRKLSKVAEMIANRQNAIFLPINILLLWDIQCMIALESWKERSGQFLGRWIETVAELEALSSLALISYDHPEWAVPEFKTEISGEDAGIKAKQIGHPLLKDSVCNDLELNQGTGILLITGSNMSGKSTLLRTTGINLVLAYAGAPVCAQSFSCSLFKIHTCMRVNDNLGENISSFYAELLRIKEIVAAAKTENNIFFLLDEIFKGTNSQDRHAGAKVLIRQLSKAGAMGLVSTHDLELGILEDESEGRIRNFHFREFYDNNEIHFDYQLRLGISTTRNAMYLIKMAGIDVN